MTEGRLLIVTVYTHDSTPCGVVSAHWARFYFGDWFHETRYRAKLKDSMSFISSFFTCKNIKCGRARAPLWRPIVLKRTRSACSKHIPKSDTCEPCVNYRVRCSIKTFYTSNFSCEFWRIGCGF